MSEQLIFNWVGYIIMLITYISLSIKFITKDITRIATKDKILPERSISPNFTFIRVIGYAQIPYMLIFVIVSLYQVSLVWSLIIVGLGLSNSIVYHNVLNFILNLMNKSNYDVSEVDFKVVSVFK
jgi:hypothetical protein